MSHMQQQRHTAGHNYLSFIARKGLFRLVVESIFSVRIPGPLIKPLVISKIPLGQRQAKRCLQTCTKSVESGHLAHAQSIIRPLLSISIFCSIQLFCKRTVKTNQTAQMRRLIWAFAVRICPKSRYRMPRPTSQSFRTTVLFEPKL